MPAGLNRKSAGLFADSGFSSARLMAYCLVAVLLMALDQRGSYSQQIRDTLTTIATPVFLLVDLPGRVGASLVDYFKDRDTLLEENHELRSRQLRQQVELSRLESLGNENQRLRSLLGARSGLRVEGLMAELLDVDLDPWSHRVILDRGSDDGLVVGMVVVDAGGILGQIETVSPLTAGVILISDPDHALPVQVVRTGMRSLAFGSGDTSVLMLPNVSINADIRSGDILETSGLGRRFPAGYRVAEVMSVERDPGQAFARVWARPLAQLDKAREVLVLKLTPPEKSSPPEIEPAIDSLESQ